MFKLIAMIFISVLEWIERLCAVTDCEEDRKHWSEYAYYSLGAEISVWAEIRDLLRLDRKSLSWHGKRRAAVRAYEALSPEGQRLVYLVSRIDDPDDCYPEQIGQQIRICMDAAPAEARVWGEVEAAWQMASLYPLDEAKALFLDAERRADDAAIELAREQEWARYVEEIEQANNS